MATFQIHQDIENIPPRNRGVGKTKIPLSKIYIPKKRHNESRLALQPVNSKQEPEVKRRKLNNVKTNSKISVILSVCFCFNNYFHVFSITKHFSGENNTTNK